MGFRTLAIALGCIFWVSTGLTQGLSRSAVEQLLQERVNTIIRPVILGDEAQARLRLVASDLIQGVLVWHEDGSLLYPNDHGLAHFSDQLALANRQRLSQWPRQNNYSVWRVNDPEAQLLEYCYRSPVAVCALVRTSTLSRSLKVSNATLLAALFPRAWYLKPLAVFSCVALIVCLLWLVRALWRKSTARGFIPELTTPEPAIPEPVIPEADIVSQSGRIIYLQDLRLDINNQLAQRALLEVSVSQRDIALLQYFYEHPGQVISKDRLYDVGWGRDFVASSRALEQHIITLRRKLDPHRDLPPLIETVHGQGYRYPPRGL